MEVEHMTFLFPNPESAKLVLEWWERYILWCLYVNGYVLGQRLQRDMFPIWVTSRRNKKIVYEKKRKNISKQTKIGWLGIKSFQNLVGNSHVPYEFWGHYNLVIVLIILFQAVASLQLPSCLWLVVFFNFFLTNNIIYIKRVRSDLNFKMNES